ncbi:transposase [Paraburkholderia sp. CNPSo 3076]|uniref:transposase n=1 Tax=Paraburkholderia sp. CNPSo 3076 TaxID=2940936 RepID=UPI00224CDD90|nr:transposase [Paraburkholderia sp. CNPSo 3076]MCX5539350.1 transposase [Paraburkholderia sp. CNPSo 3076]
MKMSFDAATMNLRRHFPWLVAYARFHFSGKHGPRCSGNSLQPAAAQYELNHKCVTIRNDCPVGHRVEKRMSFTELSDEEWARLRVLFSGGPVVRRNNRGRPRTEPRIVANAVLWVLTTGQPWSSLPARYPSRVTCRNRFVEWLMSGTLALMVQTLTQSGRTFVCVPEPAPVRHERKRDTVGVCWVSPETWQAPPCRTNPVRTACSPDQMADIARPWACDTPQASSVLPQPTGDSCPGSIQCYRSWDSLAAYGTHVTDGRGYEIRVAVYPMRSTQFRAWVEIMKDGKRVQRSGLIGPRFEDYREACQFGLDWASQWVDRECRTLPASITMCTRTRALAAPALPAVHR